MEMFRDAKDILAIDSCNSRDFDNLVVRPGFLRMHFSVSVLSIILQQGRKKATSSRCERLFQKHHFFDEQ